MQNHIHGKYLTARDLECSLWKSIWDVDTIKCDIVGNCSLVMPLVLCAEEKQGSIKFCISITDSLYNSGSTRDAETDRPAMDKIESQIKACYDSHPWSVEEAEQVAVETMRSAGYIHDDLKPQHVALLPQLDAVGDVVSLKPILIDLSRVKAIDSKC